MYTVLACDDDLAILNSIEIYLRIFGSLGEIVLESKECDVVQIHYRDGRSEQKSFVPEKGFYNELLSFYNGDIVSTPEKGLGDMELIFEILDQIQQG